MLTKMDIKTKSIWVLPRQYQGNTNTETPYIQRKVGISSPSHIATDFGVASS